MSEVQPEGLIKTVSIQNWNFSCK